MTCQRCGSSRVLSVFAKCSDKCFVSMNGHEKDGYVPRDLGIGGGDNVDFNLCLDCGQVEGVFPLPKSELEDVPDEPELDVFICPRCAGDENAILDTDGCTMCNGTGKVKKSDLRPELFKDK